MSIMLEGLRHHRGRLQALKGSPPGAPPLLAGTSWSRSFVPLLSFVRSFLFKGDALYSALFIGGLDLGLAPGFVPERPSRQVI